MTAAPAPTRAPIPMSARAGPTSAFAWVRVCRTSYSSAPSIRDGRPTRSWWHSDPCVEVVEGAPFDGLRERSGGERAPSGSGVDESVPRPAGDAQAVGNLVGRVRVGRHGRRGGPREVVVQDGAEGLLGEADVLERGVE